jgi:hypothetical protein
MPNAASPGNGGPHLAELKVAPTRRNAIDELPLRSVRPFRQSFLAPARANVVERAQRVPEPAVERINGRLAGPARAEAGVVVAPPSSAVPTPAPPRQPAVAPQPAAAAVDIPPVIEPMAAPAPARDLRHRLRTMLRPPMLQAAVVPAPAVLALATAAVAPTEDAAPIPVPPEATGDSRSTAPLSAQRPLRRRIPIRAMATPVLAACAVLVVAGLYRLDWSGIGSARHIVESPAPAAASSGIDATATDPAASEAARRFADALARAKAGNADAQLQVAVLYAKGDGVAQDYETAANWFRAAAEQGLARAQYDLGVLYERGRGVPVDLAQAFNWYKKAADSNYALGQFNLAVAYTKGQGTRPDYAQAAQWYARAAKQGIIPAMVNLGILYERGDGVDPSLETAYAWYRAAGRRGNQAAIRRSEELLQAFTPGQQSRGAALSVEVQGSIRDAVTERAATAPPSGPPPTLKSALDTISAGKP